MGTELSRAAVRTTLLIRETIRNRPLDSGLAVRQAGALLLEPPWGCSQEQQYTGLLEALASPVELCPFSGDPRWEKPIPEQDFRDHLRRIVAELDRMRPWTPPVLRALDDEEWASYRAPRVVGCLLLDGEQVRGRIPYLFGFDRIPEGRVRRFVVLRLRSGRDVALAAPWWPEHDDVTAVLTLDHDVPARTVMTELTAGDHFRRGEWKVYR